MSRLLATAAGIFWLGLWHWSGFGLLPGFPPAVFVATVTWAFGAWVWPSVMTTDGVREWPL